MLRIPICNILFRCLDPDLQKNSDSRSHGSGSKWQNIGDVYGIFREEFKHTLVLSMFTFLRETVKLHYIFFASKVIFLSFYLHM